MPYKALLRIDAHLRADSLEELKCQMERLSIWCQNDEIVFDHIEIERVQDPDENEIDPDEEESEDDDEATQPVNMSDRPLHISELPAKYAFVIAGAKLLDDRYHNRIAHDAQRMIDADMRNWEYHTSNGNDNYDRVTTFWRNPDNDGEVCAVLWDGQIIP